MSDVLEGGPRRSGPPRWVWLAAGVLAVVAAGGYVVVRPDHPGTPAAEGSPTSVLAPTAPTAPSPAPWPSSAGACGTTAYRPLMSLQPLAERTGVRVLVGGYGVRLVDTDTGTVRPVGGIPADAQHVIGELVPAAAAVYVLSAPCDGGAGRVYRLEGRTAHLVASAPVSDLLGGMARVWAVDYPDSAAPNNPVVLRPLGGGRSLTLPPQAYPVADTSAGVVIAVGPVHPTSGPPHVVVVDPGTARPVRTLGVGQPLATDATQVLLLGQCDQGEATASCTVTRIDLRTGQVRGRYRLPSGRVPASSGSVSRDGRRVAFQLARATSDTHFDTGHPLPPSDVVVLHLDTGRLDVVPGLELAPKTAAGLGFANDGGWVFATVSDGDHAHVLAWRPGLGSPQAVARLAGPVAWAPPLLLVA